MSPVDNQVILVASQRVYRSTDNGDTYAAVSGDLTTNPGAALVYGTITTLDISPLAPNVYYAGTDDARVWRSTDSGGTWVEISAGLPARWVTRVVADRFDSQVVYATLSGFGRDEHLAHVYRSSDRGTTWTSIAANLPDVPANDLVVDSGDAYTLFLATDVGVYATRNRGSSWFALGTGMPAQAVFDLALHVGTHTLVAGTHGRGMWRLDLAGLPTDVPGLLEPGFRLSSAGPNPSRGASVVALELGRRSAARVSVYDAAGRRVRDLHAGALGPGRHLFSWDGRSAHGSRAAAGVYFVHAEAAGASAVQRLVRLP
jgi:hypothetical protein